ncbi:MAG: ABC transporter ATP-binding protein [Deltaproteobacteria bacterium]|nr:ABC transporter ATP-binding protein [Deltaproteobacteria bacterium]
MIELTGVHKSFGSQQVLRGVDLKVQPGKITVIIGRSGGGKSVLLKHMIGLVRPDKGSVWVFGSDLAAMNEREMDPIRRRMGMLFQDAALFDSMTVGENVAFPIKEHTNLSTRIVGEMVAQKLEMVGLPGTGKKMPSELSGGMRKRVGLARAIALDPEVLLFDEPTTGLDPIMAEAIDNLIRETQSALGVTAVVISHDIAGTMRIAHCIALLNEGTIVAEGTPEEIDACADPLVRDFLRCRSGDPTARL